MARIAVIDFGKTNVKLAVVDTVLGEEVAERRMPNRTRPGPPFPHYDTAAHWDFLMAALADLGGGAEAISITTHGATAALLDGAGDLVLPTLDYEHPLPETGYDRLRPDFAVTGSPRLPAGLNLGAQLHWLFGAFPQTARVARILTYPQYWAWRLTGVAASERSSLGCHTDLWAPFADDFSPLVDRMGWRGLLPPLRRAAEVLGPIRPEVAARTGLTPDLPVLCGIHDSNASLHAHLSRRAPPFAVVSTGTWVVAMAVGAEPRDLDPGRDMLVNVNAFGEPVPSARFMGGRDHEIIRAGRDFAPRGGGPRRRPAGWPDDDALRHPRVRAVSGTAGRLDGGARRDGAGGGGAGLLPRADDRDLPGADRGAGPGHRRGAAGGERGLPRHAGGGDGAGGRGIARRGHGHGDRGGAAGGRRGGAGRGRPCAAPDGWAGRICRALARAGGGLTRGHNPRGKVPGAPQPCLFEPPPEQVGWTPDTVLDA